MKAFLEWLDEWNLGIPEIDDQHLGLADSLNQIVLSLQGAPNPSQPTEATLPLVVKLLDETRQHFLDEEGIMRGHGYPELTEHHRDHIMLLAELQEFIRDVEEGRREFGLDSLISLKHWLVNHIVDSDLAFARYLDQR
jgi:hemerythrin